MTEMLTLTHATERDIDLMLVEEFAASPVFAGWFLKQLGLSVAGMQPATVHHSTRRLHSRREIDISVTIGTAAGPVLLLVENKLDTGEQPQQAQSYRDEAAAMAPGHLAVRTVLVCPEAYMAQHRSFAEIFDAVVTYESIGMLFAARATQEAAELGARLDHRAQLMQQAIDKGRRGYVQVVHPGKKAFSDRYVALLRGNASPLVPGPSMLRDSAAESVTMIFARDTLPDWQFLPQMRIVHQLREGNANINFYGWGAHFVRLAAEMAPALRDTGFLLVPSVNKRPGGRSGLMVTARTPVVDQFADFEAQAEAIRGGIAEAERLRDWLFSHRDDAARWAEIVGAAA